MTGGLSKGETECCSWCLKGDERVTDMEKLIPDNGSGRGNDSCNTRDESGTGKHLCTVRRNLSGCDWKRKDAWKK